MKRLFLLLSTIASLGASAQETMLTSVSPARLETLLATARANYPRYKSAAARVRAAEAAVDRTKWGYAEAINFNYLYAPNGVVPLTGESQNYLRGFQLGIFVNAGRILQTPAQTRQAREEATALRYEQGVTEANLEAELKARYYRYLLQQNLLRTRTQAAVDADNMLRDVKYKYEKGERTFEAYNAILITYSQQVSQKLATEADLLIAKSNLEELLGVPLEEIK